MVMTYNPNPIDSNPKNPNPPKKHKWHKEIKAWADGAEIQYLADKWYDCIDNDPAWSEDVEYRIKPQPKESEFAHIPYWLCCGSLDPHHHQRSCSEAKAGYPERCRFGTVEQHQKRMTQPKEPQYLDLYIDSKGWLGIKDTDSFGNDLRCIGKIKLEQDDE